MSSLKVYRIEGDIPPAGIVFTSREEAERFLEMNVLGVRTLYQDGKYQFELVELGEVTIRESDIPRAD